MSTEPVEGLAALNEFFDLLPQRLAKGAVQRVLRRGAEPIRALWHDLARVRKQGKGHGPAGRFRVSIVSTSRVERSARKMMASQNAPAAVAYVGPDKNGYPEALFEEFGAAAHNETPPQAPGRRAWEAQGHNALDAITAGLGPELEATAARYAKRTGG